VRRQVKAAEEGMWHSNSYNIHKNYYQTQQQRAKCGLKDSAAKEVAVADTMSEYVSISSASHRSRHAAKGLRLALTSSQ